MAKVRRFTVKVNRPKTYKGKSTRPGGGGRFKMMEDALMRKGMSKERADAIAAAKGRAKYGKRKMANWAAQGKKRAAAKRGIRRRK